MINRRLIFLLRQKWKTCLLLLGRYRSWTGSTRIAHLGSNEKCFFKPKLFDVCADFTKVSLEIRARMISRGLIIFFTSIRGERSELIWSDFCTCYFCSLIRRFVGLYLEARSQLICFFLNLCHRSYSVRKKLIQISSFRVAITLRDTVKFPPGRRKT